MSKEQGKGMSSESCQGHSPISDLDQHLVYRMLCLLLPADRLVASEVCRTWHELITSRAWTEFTSISLNSMPSERIIPILRRCPKVRQLICADLDIPVKFIQKAILTTGRNLQSLRVYNCKQLQVWQCFGTEIYVSWRNDIFDYVFGPEVSFVWHCDEISVDGEICLPQFIAVPNNNICQLQLSGVSVILNWQVLGPALSNLTRLESLLLACWIELATSESPSTEELAKMFQPLVNLKDACFAAFFNPASESPACITEAIAIAAKTAWPRIQLLWFAFDLELNCRSLASLTRDIPSLRTIVFADCHVDAVTFANNEEPQPPKTQRPTALCVFCSESVAAHLRQIRFNGRIDVMRHREEETPGQFLARPENAECFKDYWVTAMISDAERRGFEIGTFQVTKDAVVLERWPFQPNGPASKQGGD